MAGQKSILIVDDDALVRQLYAVKLQKAGFAVREAGDGDSGLAEAFSSKPDLIVLDILMPRMNGYEVLKKLRASGEWGAQVPVIVLTNDELDKNEEFDAVETATPAYFLMKTNTTPSDVIAKIEDLLT